MMLTAQQVKALNFLQDYIQTHQISPTISEIALAMANQSKGTVHRMIQALVAEGFIELVPGKHRNIQLTGKHLTHTHTLPIIGRIAAGQPIEAILQHETLNFADLLGKDHYVLVVKGDSMIDEGIYDGDYIICRHATTADNGKIVVALVDGQHATLKRFYFDGERQITLIPANSRLQPVTYPAERIVIQGVLIGLLRNMH